MTTQEVNTSLIGRRVKGIFTGLEITGTITDIVDRGHAAGVEIKLDSPVQWGEHIYERYQSTSRKHDNYGNLRHTELI